MAKTVDITASYVGADITFVDVYDVWPGGTLLTGSFTDTEILQGKRLTNIADSIFTFVLVDTATSASSALKTLPAPTISEFNPTQGQTGDIIGITGSGLFGTTNVTIGDKIASFEVISNTNISASVPLDASGSNTITVTTPAGSGGRFGWSYDGGSGLVVFNLGSFVYGNNSTEACSEQTPETGLYSTAGNTIQTVFEVNGQTWTDQALTQAPVEGWYREPSSLFSYFITSTGYVVERSTCSDDTDVILNPI